ncbi:alpha/beta fold hydrolase [Actinoplanes sp. NPDC026619]|uniref:alpha/beta fold hydrolase n=1 Tax=Actinoplanes sp. NPDC026619 TaxID=3155798 RepID=UPI0033F8D266
MSRVMLLHGLASSFARNWRDPGWVDLLTEAGHDVTPLSLPGHGLGPQPTDPQAYADNTGHLLREITRAIGNGGARTAAVGFSAGADGLLNAAAQAPARFDRLALLGIGDAALADDTTATDRLAAALAGPEDPTDVPTRLFRRMAAAAGNDLPPIVAYLRRPRRPPEPEELKRIACPVLLVLGDRDPAGPADRLAGALPDARLVTLRGVDHFTTTSSPAAMEAVMRFLAA